MAVHHNYQQGDQLQLKAVRIITQTQQQALVAYRSRLLIAGTINTGASGTASLQTGDAISASAGSLYNQKRSFNWW